MLAPQAQGYAVRSATTDDIPALIDLYAACDLADYGEAYPNAPENVREWLADAVQTWLVTAPDGAIAGYGSIADQGGRHVRLNADIYVHPDYKGRGIATALLALIAARAAEQAELAPAGAQVVLHNGMSASNIAAHAINERAGFALVRAFWRMRIDMTEPPPAPAWPAGITVRTFVPSQDDQAVFATVENAFEDHWGYVPMPYTEFAKKLARPDFDPNLWWLVLEGDAIVGVTLGMVENAAGWINKVAVRRPWRKRGIAMALLCQAFGVYYQRGIMRVELGVDAASLTGAQRIYEQAGMHVAAEFAVFEKVLRQGSAEEVGQLAD